MLEAIGKKDKKGPSKLTLMVSADFLTMWSNTKLIVLIGKSVGIGVRSKEERVENDDNTIQKIPSILRVS